MKEHLKFAFKVAIALLVMNAVLGLLGSAGTTIKGIINNPLSGVNLFGSGGGSSAA